MSSATGAKRATELSFKFKENGLLINSFLVGFEDVSLYQQGGHHPVHIGDCLGEQEEYRVIHKLGSGGYGIVWLCRVLGRHSTEYVAVKILAASDSGQYNVERRIDGLPDEKVLDILGHPRKAPIIVREGFRAPGAHAPDYAVYQIQIDRATEEKCRLVSERICVIDFGESYEQSRVPTGGYGIPMPYSAPVLVLDGQYRPASDIWALAVAMFYIRTGRELFFSLSTLVAWENRREIFADEPDEDGNAVLVKHVRHGPPPSIRGDLDTVVLHCAQRKEALPKGERLLFPEEEQHLFANLISQMCRYNLDERPSIEQVLRHPWFSFEEEDRRFSFITVFFAAFRARVSMGTIFTWFWRVYFAAFRWARK